MWHLFCLNWHLQCQKEAFICEKRSILNAFFWRFNHQNQGLTFMKWTPGWDHSKCIRVDRAIQEGGAGEGQLFGLKIKQLKFGKFLKIFFTHE